MAIREIKKDNDPVLRQIAEPVEELNDEIIEIIEDMVETMEDAQGVGLAAPQIGIPKRLIVVALGKGDHMKLINPTIIKKNGEKVDVEGCLILPGRYGEVIRSAEVTVRAVNIKGKAIEITGKDMLARILEHEIDHLNGCLFVDKVEKYVD